MVAKMKGILTREIGFKFCYFCWDKIRTMSSNEAKRKWNVEDETCSMCLYRQQSSGKFVVTLCYFGRCKITVYANFTQLSFAQGKSLKKNDGD